MAEFGDLDFHVTPLDHIIKSEDYDSTQCHTFCITVVATFMPPILDDDDEEEEEEEDESRLYNDDIECELKEEEFPVLRDQLLHVDEEISRSIISGILTDMNVPTRAFMIDRILTCARRMASDHFHSGRKVLRIGVNIDVPPGFESSFNDENLVPATPSSIEALETVKVEEEGPASNTLCTVCFEKIPIGSEATRLTCFHVYHCGCIRSWLGKSRFCPLCRYEIS